MVLADYIAIGVALLSLLIGFSMGFGKVLEFITSGFIGLLISIVVTWFFFGTVYDLSFVQDLVQKMLTYFNESQNAILALLVKLRIDLVAVALALFIVVTIARVIIVKIAENIFDAESGVMKYISKALGAVLFVAFVIVIVLLVFQVFKMVQPDGNFITENLTGSMLKLDQIYAENPLNSFILKLLEGNPLNK